MTPVVTGSIRAVLFDLDGTLIDSAPDLGVAVNKLRTDRGLPALPLSDYRSVAGAGARGMLSVAFGMGVDHPDFPAMREEFFDNYERCIHDRTHVFDGVGLLLDRLRHRSMQWGVVTNKIQRFTSLITSRMPLFASAAAVVSGDTTPYLKPHPQPLLEAASRLRVLPEQCIYVGDDERDIQAGRAAGMKTVAATYGYLGHHAQPEEWGADAMIDSPGQLLKWLDLD